VKLKSITTASLLSVLLVFSVLNHPTTVTAGYFDWATVSIFDDATTAAPDNAGSNSAPKKEGNSFARALGAPFRAISRLFGGGKKNEMQVRRTTEKDAAKFESASVTRVNDARLEPQAPAAPAASTSPAVSVNVPAATAKSALASAFDSHLQLGRDRLLAGDIDGAIAELATATSISPKSAEANNLMGIAYESKGLHDRALQAFEVSIHADGSNAEHLNNLGFLLYKTADYERATKYLKRAAKISPKDARIWNNLALTQCQRGKFDEAYDSFVKASDEYGGHLNIAAQFQAHGYAKDAITHLEKAQALHPNSADVLTKLVALYDLTGRATDAESARRSLVALKTFADANK